jgi:hypothetical protein
MGGLTSCSPCFRSHRRPWRNCARARTTHSRTQADADDSPDVKHAWWRHCEGPTRRTHNLRANDNSQCGAKHTSPRWRDSHSVRRVPHATADRGGSAPVHAGMHAHRQTQRPAPASNTRGGDSVRGIPTRHRRTRTLSARRQRSSRRKTNANTLRCGGGAHSLLAMFNMPPPTVV